MTTNRQYTGRAGRAFRALVWATYEPICHLCRGKIDSYSEYEPDHLVPVSAGGAMYDVANARPAHGRNSAPELRCNPRRQARPLDTSRMVVADLAFFNSPTLPRPDLGPVPPPGDKNFGGNPANSTELAPSSPSPAPLVVIAHE